MITYGLSAAARFVKSPPFDTIRTYTRTYILHIQDTEGKHVSCSTRVSNELGAGNTGRAKDAMAVTLKLSFILGIAFVLALASGHNLWAGLFTQSRTVIKDFASLTPFLAISITVDSAQGVLSGKIGA